MHGHQEYGANSLFLDMCIHMYAQASRRQKWISDTTFLSQSLSVLVFQAVSLNEFGAHSLLAWLGLKSCSANFSFCLGCADTNSTFHAYTAVSD